MGFLKTEKFKKNDLKFSYSINVDKEGNFTTTLPSEIVNLFKKANIDLKRNRLRNEGFFSASTLKELEQQISDIVAEYYSRECIESKIVIKYIVQTTCAYCHNTKGDIVPNGAPEWTESKEYHWCQGTIDQHSNQPKPYGIRVFARAYTKEVYKYKSGAIKTEYLYLHPEKEDGQYLYHLNEFCSIAEPAGEKCKEIDYSEDVAEFFVVLLTSICKINDAIKDKLEPEKIKEIAQNKQKLLP